VRSVGDRQGIGCDAFSSPFARGRREGEVCRPRPEVVNETILVEVQTKRVSMPSALPAGAGAGRGLFAVRAGSVKERRSEAIAGGARSGVVESSGDAMVGISDGHGRFARVGMEIAWV
jgi:hypothetical protein